MSSVLDFVLLICLLNYLSSFPVYNYDIYCVTQPKKEKESKEKRDEGFTFTMWIILVRID